MWNVEVVNEMDRLRREMDSLFSNYGRSRVATTYPLVNVYDGKDAIVVTAELPGMTKDKVSISFTDGLLSIKGRLEPSRVATGMTPIRQERSEGDFDKTLRIPTKVEPDKIGATFVNGILTITMPKAEEAKPKTIAIQAQ